MFLILLFYFYTHSLLLSNTMYMYIYLTYCVDWNVVIEGESNESHPVCEYSELFEGHLITTLQISF